MKGILLSLSYRSHSPSLSPRLRPHPPRQSPPCGLAPAEAAPKYRRAHCLRSDRAATCCGSWVHRTSWVCPPRQAARERAFPTSHLRRVSGRAPSHNGARYASVRSKTRSHVALSGAPPRCLQAEKSGALHAPHFSTFRQPFGLEQKAFCSLGAAVGESGRDGWCERRRKTLRGTQERPPVGRP